MKRSCRFITATSVPDAEREGTSGAAPGPGDYPRTEFARTGLDRACEFDKPIDSEEERVFFQKMEKDFWARLENPFSA